MKKIFLKLSELLYPRRCPLCDGILGEKEPLLCRACGESLEFIKEPRCFRCGKPLSLGEAEYCGSCLRGDRSFQRNLALFPYQGKYRQSILRFKYRGRQEYARFYSAAMVKTFRGQIRRWDPQVLVPVPIHRERLLKRGYNQAEVLADKLGEALGIPVASQAVLRRKNTAAQKLLDKRQRRKNLRQAFVPGREIRPWKSALILDDIYTTGSTLDAVAEVLKKAGTERVYALCVCIAPGEEPDR